MAAVYLGSRAMERGGTHMRNLLAPVLPVENSPDVNHHQGLLKASADVVDISDCEALCFLEAFVDDLDTIIGLLRPPAEI